MIPLRPMLKSLIPRVQDRIAMMRGAVTDSNTFLRHVSGVIHVGANTGQERKLYDQLGLRVLWIEPNPFVFQKLQRNIAGYPKQIAVQALLSNGDGDEMQFHISNNGGKSSSVLDLKHHREMWPEVSYRETITLNTVTLPTLLERGWIYRGINPYNYQALVLDTQGSELLILEGCGSSLAGFKFVKVEVADFESYAGCCQVDDVQRFMEQRGYDEVARLRFAKRAGIGRYFDITYRRAA